MFLKNYVESGLHNAKVKRDIFVARGKSATEPPLLFAFEIAYGRDVSGDEAKSS